MFKVIRLQFVAALVGCVIGAVLLGSRGAISALLGGAACFIPSLLFALRLARVVRTRGDSHMTELVIGEAIKIAAAIGILVAVRFLYPDAHWGAVVMGLIITLQANFFGLLVKS
jgi:ATP synthase protein I